MINYLYLIPIGLLISFVMLFVSQSYMRKYSYAVDDVERANLLKPFRFKFWVTMFILSIVSLGFFSVLGYKVSALMGA